MQTAVTKRGQTVIPASIRKRYHIKEGDHLVWIDDGESIRVIPVSQDPIRALRGSGRGERLVERLLLTRNQEDATLLHKDPQFEVLTGQIKLESLPYKGHSQRSP